MNGGQVRFGVTNLDARVRDATAEHRRAAQLRHVDIGHKLGHFVASIHHTRVFLRELVDDDAALATL